LGLARRGVARGTMVAENERANDSKSILIA